MQCGIFVMIRSNRLVIFSPFVNTDYRNDWRGRLRVGSVDGSVEKYFSQKSLQYREENFIGRLGCGPAPSLHPPLLPAVNTSPPILIKPCSHLTD